jgi:fatty-acyl-CoA synthase
MSRARATPRETPSERGQREPERPLLIPSSDNPEKVAIRFAGAEITYGDLEHAVAGLAGALRERWGVAAGDRVAYLGFNHPLVLELLYACARLGAIFVPLNWRLAPPEHREILRDCSPNVLIVGAELGAQAGEIGAGVETVETDALDVLPAPGPALPTVEPAAPVLLVYTSGATGRPKGVLLTQQALAANARNSIAAHELTSADHVLTVLPMFHVGGLNIHTTPALAAGARVTLHPRFDAEAALCAIAADRPTMLLVVPQVSAAMTSHPAWNSTDLSSLRLVTTGSSIIPAAVIRAWHDRGVPVTQVYGLTESAPVAICLRREDARRKAGSCGRPAIHCEARVLDETGREVPSGGIGEIVLRGPNLLREYWGDPDATNAALVDGWLRTGDLGHQDGEGFFYVDDRKKDLVISGGENIRPAELENVLAECAAVLEAAVVGRADDRWGEIPVAFVVTKPGSVLTHADVLALFEGRLARFKHPRDVLFLDRLPRNAMGKVLKQELRARSR